MHRSQNTPDRCCCAEGVEHYQKICLDGRGMVGFTSNNLQAVGLGSVSVSTNTGQRSAASDMQTSPQALLAPADQPSGAWAPNLHAKGLVSCLAEFLLPHVTHASWLMRCMVVADQDA